MQDLAAISKSFEESQLESFKSGFYVNKERIYKKYQKYTQANRLAIRYAVRHMSITPDLKLKSRFHSKDFLTEDITLNINSQKYRKSPHLPWDFKRISKLKPLVNPSNLHEKRSKEKSHHASIDDKPYSLPPLQYKSAYLHESPKSIKIISKKNRNHKRKVTKHEFGCVTPICIDIRSPEEYLNIDKDHKDPEWT